MDVKLPDGTTITDVPEDMTQTQLLAKLARNGYDVSKLSPAAAPEEDKPYAGFSGAFMDSASTLASSDEAAAWKANPTEENRRALIKAAKSKYKGAEFGEGRNFEAFKQLAGGSLGWMAAPTAAGLASSFVTTPVGGAAIGAATNTAQYATSNLIRQAREQEEALKRGETVEGPNLTKALTAAAGSAALDVAGQKFIGPLMKAFPGVRNLVFPTSGNAAKTTAAMMQDAFEKGTVYFAKGVAKGVGKNVAFEMPQEVAQQALERWQAGLSLTDEDAKKEFLQAAQGAAILGGVVGGASGAVDSYGKRKAAKDTLSATGVIPPSDTVSADPIDDLPLPPEVIAEAKRLRDESGQDEEDAIELAQANYNIRNSGQAPPPPPPPPPPPGAAPPRTAPPAQGLADIDPDGYVFDNAGDYEAAQREEEVGGEEDTPAGVSGVEDTKKQQAAYDKWARDNGLRGKKPQEVPEADRVWEEEQRQLEGSSGPITDEQAARRIKTTKGPDLFMPKAAAPLEIEKSSGETISLKGRTAEALATVQELSPGAPAQVHTQAAILMARNGSSLTAGKALQIAFQNYAGGSVETPLVVAKQQAKKTRPPGNLIEEKKLAEEARALAAESAPEGTPSAVINRAADIMRRSTRTGKPVTVQEALLSLGVKAKGDSIFSGSDLSRQDYENTDKKLFAGEDTDEVAVIPEKFQQGAEKRAWATKHLSVLINSTPSLRALQDSNADIRYAITAAVERLVSSKESDARRALYEELSGPHRAALEFYAKNPTIPDVTGVSDLGAPKEEATRKLPDAPRGPDVQEMGINQLSYMTNKEFTEDQYAEQLEKAGYAEADAEVEAARKERKKDSFRKRRREAYAQFRQTTGETAGYGYSKTELDNKTKEARKELERDLFNLSKEEEADIAAADEEAKAFGFSDPEKATEERSKDMSDAAQRKNYYDDAMDVSMSRAKPTDVSRVLPESDLIKTERSVAPSKEAAYNEAMETRKASEGTRGVEESAAPKEKDPALFDAEENSVEFKNKRAEYRASMEAVGKKVPNERTPNENNRGLSDSSYGAVLEVTQELQAAALDNDVSAIADRIGELESAAKSTGDDVVYKEAKRVVGYIRSTLADALSIRKTNPKEYTEQLAAIRQRLAAFRDLVYEASKPKDTLFQKASRVEGEFTGPASEFVAEEIAGLVEAAETGDPTVILRRVREAQDAAKAAIAARESLGTNSTDTARVSNFAKSASYFYLPLNRALENLASLAKDARDAQGKKGETSYPDVVKERLEMFADVLKTLQQKIASNIEKLKGELTQAKKPTSVPNAPAARAFKGLLAKGDITGALSWITKNSTNRSYRAIAKLLLRGGLGNTTLKFVDAENFANNGTTKFNADGSSVITLYGTAGANPETVLHEALHAFIQQRWHSINAYTAKNKGVVNDTSKRYDVIIKDFTALWSSIKDAIAKADPDLVNKEVWAEQFASSPDEALAWLTTNPEAQKYLQSINVNGEKLKTEQKSLWNKVVDFVKSLFADPSAVDRSALAALMDYSIGILEAGRRVAPDSSYGRSIVQQRTKESRAAAAELQDVADILENSDSPGEILNAMARGVKARSPAAVVASINEKFIATPARVIRAWAKLIPTSDLAGWRTKMIPGVRKAWELVQKASAEANNMAAAAEKLIYMYQDYVGKYGQTTMSALMDSTRRFSIDPAKFSDINAALTGDLVMQFLRSIPSSAKVTAALTKREADLRSVYALWDTLGTHTGGHALYKRVRQYYRDMYQVERTRRIDNAKSIASGSSLQSVMDTIKAIEDAIMTPGDDFYAGAPRPQLVDQYFPHMRFGNYELRFSSKENRKAGDPPYEYHRFDTNAERKVKIKELEAKYGLNLKKDKAFFEIRYAPEEDAFDPSSPSAILSNMYEAIDKIPGTTTMDAAAKDELKRALNEGLLHRMPSRSLSLRQIESRDVPGHSMDYERVLRATASSYASQIPKLKYAVMARAELKQARIDLKQQPSEVAERLALLVDEMEKRVNDNFEPESRSAIGDFLTRATYLMLLTSGATAFIQTTVIPMRLMPAIGSRYGNGAASVKLMKWAKLVDTVTITDTLPDGSTRKVLPTMEGSSLVTSNPLLNRAFMEMKRRGAFNSLPTNAITNKEKIYKGAPADAKSIIGRLRGKSDVVYRAMTGAFSTTELLSRQSGAMAWFELAYENKRNKAPGAGFDKAAFDEAVEEASAGVTKAAGDFSDFERPAFMRNSAGRFFLQFKMFSFITTKFFLLAARDSMYGETPEVKRRAMKELGSVLLMGAVFSGYTGLPIYWPVTFIIDNVLKLIEDDDDEDKKKRRYKDPLTADSSDQRFRMYMADMFGEASGPSDPASGFKWSHVLEKGPVSAFTGADFASRTSYNGMWVRDSNAGNTFKETARNFILSNIAPGISMSDSMLGGIDDFARGDIARGIAKMVPGLVKGIPNAIRYNTEGVANTKGDVTIKPEDISTLDTINTVLGFQMSRATLIEKAKSQMVSAEKRQTTAKNALLQRHNEYKFQAGHTPEERAAIDKRIAAYNKRYPRENMQIDADTLDASEESYLNKRALMLRGVELTEDDIDFKLPRIRAAEE